MVRFIDLFAGLGGIRIGFENAFKRSGFETECVLTSEIKPYAVKALNENFSHGNFVGDIFNVDSKSIPDFDFLLGGFPCQPFSSSGKRKGFLDTRGTLFFEIERILKDKKPYGFVLENVEGLVKHDSEFKTDKIGRTLSTIIHSLDALGYNVTHKIFDSLDFGLPQSRKRIFIVGTKKKSINLDGHQPHYSKLKDFLESGLPVSNSDFVRNIFAHYKLEDLYGKSIKDKRGGSNNIHSWDIGLKGKVTKDQSNLLNLIFKKRRSKQWATEIEIDWMDGMPLTTSQIMTFVDFSFPKLQKMLDELTRMGYLKFEHPKKLVVEGAGLDTKKFRVYDETKEKGYNIVAGKLSFEINKILDPNGIAPTLVATDVSRLAVPDNGGLRKLTVREGLNLFGYPESYQLNASQNEAFDLLGNTVAIPVVEFVASRVAENFRNYSKKNHLTTSKVTPVCS